MSDQQDSDEHRTRRDYKPPFSYKHPVPTIERYKEHRSDLDGQQEEAEGAQQTVEDDTLLKRTIDSAKNILHTRDKDCEKGDPYPTANRHIDNVDRETSDYDSGIPLVPQDDQVNIDEQNGDGTAASKNSRKGWKHHENGQSATETAANHSNPKQKRKDMKHNKRDDGGRVVTDPVTHLPVVIRDSTNKDLARAPENEPSPGTISRSQSSLATEQEELQENYDGMQRLFPPPDYEDTQAELIKTYQLAITVGLGAIVTLASTVVFLLLVIYSGSPSALGDGQQTVPKRSLLLPSTGVCLAAGLGFGLVVIIRCWLGHRVKDIFEDEVWDAARRQEAKLNMTKGRLPESVAWVNSLLASVWPLINPDLFASIVDMLEDVMQASLPRVVRMVNIDDLGQGSESVRILGIRWLPSGAASQSVDEEGNIKPPSNKETNDRGASDEGELQDKEDENKERDSGLSAKEQKAKNQREQESLAIREGMEAEQGDFVNMELAFAYRARSSGKSIKSKAKNAHLFLKFYLPGGIFVPVWVEVRGLIGTIRLRLQLTPDPPFFSLCTLTFLGQPKADLSCTPLSRHLPNLMDVPLISSFVQSSIDAALAEYVAPRSLTLDLKDMLVGDDFKKDTVTRGVLLVFIKEANGFKEGDGGIGPMKGSSDAYVTCSWGKFGKTLASTRVILKDQHPKWHEWAYLLVSPEEINADEKLRLQLWDSDRYTADDDLGRVEVSLKDIMHSEKTRSQMCDREDRFVGQDQDEKMPGSISWSVGYFPKTRITDEQLRSQTQKDGMNSKEDLKRHVSEMAERKLREASSHDESKQIAQEKLLDYREQENALFIASPPDETHPSGILSIQIHNITGLEVEKLQKEDKENAPNREDEAEHSDDLPSSYCTIIINHNKIYRTRTKPKNAKPFFNAGTERFIKDWRTTEIVVSVRDDREREKDGLLGIVYLPLNKLFEKRSQVMDIFPLVGGIGFGRVRISLVFRSIELQLPPNLLGWDYGTLEIKGHVKVKGALPENLHNHRIKLCSNLARGKMQATGNEWEPKHGKTSLYLPCRKRYAMPLVVEFRTSSLMTDSTPAFGVFWLQDICDEEDNTITIQVWKGGKENLKRAKTCHGYNGLEDGEQPLGEIILDVKFWRGLSGYHKHFANKSKHGDVRDVMEVLDTVIDEKEADSDATHDHSDSDDSSDDENESHRNTPSTSTTSSASRPQLKSLSTDSAFDTDDHSISVKHPIKKTKQIARNLMSEHNDSDDGRRGLRAQMRDYKDHRKELHRRHRGLMQWKGARSLDWAWGKVRRAEREVKDFVGRQEEGEDAVETEV